MPTDHQDTKQGHQADPVYLDCNASSPVDPRVVEAMQPFWTANPANVAAQFHRYGQQGHRCVEQARDQLAALVGARAEEVVFTSGATESNNLALLGMVDNVPERQNIHVVSSTIEHPAVLEPLEYLRGRGFEIDLVAPGADGVVRAQDVLDAVRPHTAMVSLMHVNNVLGTIQPVGEVAERLEDHPALFHVDAAQGAAHHFEDLSHRRVDLISISAHKMYGPKGIGALVYRRRPGACMAIAPRSFGGGHEGGLRPGTVATPLVVGLGEAADLCRLERDQRQERNAAFRQSLLAGLAPLSPTYHGASELQVLHTVYLSFPGVRSRAALLRLRDVIAASNGAACHASDNRPSHVIEAIGAAEMARNGGLRLSWHHDTPPVDWDEVVARLAPLTR